MNIYSVLAKMYSLLDIVYFSESGTNPRKVIDGLIPDEKIRVLDMCCGTLSNTVEIAKKKPLIKVIGVDLSKDMLKIAKSRIQKQNLKNVFLKYGDATNTKLKSDSFDYVIIGLVLHESSPELIQGLLDEAYRLLKQNGRLIVLEWEKQTDLKRKIKYAPIYLLEKINCRTFKEFFNTDKSKYFKDRGLEVVNQYHCNYSIVLELKKSYHNFQEFY